MRRSLAGRVAAALAGSCALGCLGTALAARYLPAWAAAAAAFLLCTPLFVYAALQVTRPWIAVIRAVRDGILSLRDHDFSVSIAAPADTELTALTEGYNRLGDLLRRERLDLYQRELLLDTVIQSSP